MVTLVFYSTSSCAYCRPIRTMLENLQPEYEDKVVFNKIVVDKDYGGMDLAREWGVNAVPTILIIADREEKERLIGDIDREKVVAALEKYSAKENA